MSFIIDICLLQQRTWSPSCRLEMPSLYKVKALLSEDQRAAATTATAAASRSLPLNVSHKHTFNIWKSFCDDTTSILVNWSPQICAGQAVTLTWALFPVHVATADYLSTLSMSSTSLGSDSELTGLDSALWSSAVELRRGDNKGTLLKVWLLYFPMSSVYNIYMYYCSSVVTQFSAGCRERPESDSASL